jgi:hypothetical protein
VELGERERQERTRIARRPGHGWPGLDRRLIYRLPI